MDPETWEKKYSAKGHTPFNTDSVKEQIDEVIKRVYEYFRNINLI